MPRGIYPRKPKENDMAKAKANLVTEHIDGVKVEDPTPVPPIKQMMRMLCEANCRANKLRRLYDLTKEAKEHLGEKEFANVERAVFKEFQAAVLDLSTGVASAAAEGKNDDDDDEDTF